MAALILLNLFVFGYWEQLTDNGLDVEESLWGGVLFIVLILFSVFDKAWKKICDKICDAL